MPRSGTRSLGARVIAVACALAVTGCGYVVIPEDRATPTPAIAVGEWSAMATAVQAVEGGLQVDVALRNDTGEWSAFEIADTGAVTLVDASGGRTPCGTAFVGTGGQSLAPGLIIRGYTAGTKSKPVTRLLSVTCEGAALAPGSGLEVAYSYTTGDFNYYRPVPPRTANLRVDLDALAQPTYPGTPAEGLMVAKVGEPIEAINDNTLTLTAAERTAEGFEFTWHTENPSEYPVYVHIGIPPVVGSDGVIYGRYLSPHRADTPITPANGFADWTTSVDVPADVQGLFVMPAVETEQQKNFRSHAIDLLAAAVTPGSPGPSTVVPTTAPSVVVTPGSPGPSTVVPTTAPSVVVTPGSPGPSTVVPTTAPSGSADRPEWFGMEMTDVQTGETFTINDFAGKVVLLETIGVWCPTCRRQQDEVLRLHELLGDPADLVSISLDTAMSEDAPLLKEYAETLGYDWHLALAPLLVARALGNLYSAEYLNPPASPMLIVDRDGNVIGLPYGVKTAESLQGVVAPLLGP
jgi:hypothetical protein